VLHTIAITLEARSAIERVDSSEESVVCSAELWLHNVGIVEIGQ
jgi:hypothetical protein